MQLVEKFTVKDRRQATTKKEEDTKEYMIDIHGLFVNNFSKHTTRHVLKRITRSLIALYHTAVLNARLLFKDE